MGWLTFGQPSSGFTVQLDTSAQDRLRRLGRDGVRTLVRKLRPTFSRGVRKIHASMVKKAPLDTGHLRGSAESRDESPADGSGLAANFSFGGLAAAYAEIQHERADYYHPRAGQHHYLSGRPNSAIDEELPKLEQAMQAAADRALGEMMP